jgi:hypothetical protein
LGDQEEATNFEERVKAKVQKKWGNSQK